MDGMSARSLRALEEHEGASGGASEHWSSMEEFGAGICLYVMTWRDTWRDP